MLTVDACISPDGGLVIACHSGGPDWGSGPTGKGKLFKVVVHRPRTSAAGGRVGRPGRAKCALSSTGPCRPKLLHDVLDKAKLTGGRYVRAGDRFESLCARLRGRAGTKAGAAVRCAAALGATHAGWAHAGSRDRPGFAGRSLRARRCPDDGPTDIGRTRTHCRSTRQIDLDFDLSGCEATWQPAAGGPTWTGWLPHFDLDVSPTVHQRQCTARCAVGIAGRPGELTLRGQLDLTDMLRPAVQPGSKIDYEYPPESVDGDVQNHRPTRRH